MSLVILILIVPTLIKAPGVVMVVDSIRYCVNASRKEDKLQPKNLFQVEENGKEIQMFSFLLNMLLLCPSYTYLREVHNFFLFLSKTSKEIGLNQSYEEMPATRL